VLSIHRPTAVVINNRPSIGVSDATQWSSATYTARDMRNPTPLVRLVMVALCNRADHNIFMLFLLLLLFSLPTLSGRRLDVYHTLAHGVALVRI